jgi:hypothetical protein
MRMKIYAIVAVVAIVTLWGIRTWKAPVVKAQSAPSLIQVDYVQGPVSGCVTHTGISTFCYGTDGAVFSKAGAAYGGNFAVPSAAVAGVTSFAGRTGAVVPTAGDYSYQMLSPGATITSTAK